MLRSKLGQITISIHALIYISLLLYTLLSCSLSRRDYICLRPMEIIGYHPAGIPLGLISLYIYLGSAPPSHEVAISYVIYTVSFAIQALILYKFIVFIEQLIHKRKGNSRR